MQGILFIEYLYHRTIGGFKTQTRREGSLKAVNENPEDWLIIAKTLDDSGDNKPIGTYSATFRSLDDTIPCFARYKVGEVLYIKEPTIKIHSIFSASGFGYKYGSPSDNDCVNSTGQIIKSGTLTAKPIKFNNKLFMPAEAARAFIQITSVSVERLASISADDAIAEGIEMLPDGRFKRYDVLEKDKASYGSFESPIHSFFSLFRWANKIKRGADLKNIWVWKYSFKYLPDYKSQDHE